jgi:ribosome-associated protein
LYFFPLPQRPVSLRQREEVQEMPRRLSARAGAAGIPVEEIEITAMRASGPGGQNVNKVASAIHLRFDVRASSLPAEVKERLLALRDRRISAKGVIVIKAQRYRTREQNRAEALARLDELLAAALARRKPRKPTRPTRAARERRLGAKRRTADRKSLRARVSPDA